MSKKLIKLALIRGPVFKFLNQIKPIVGYRHSNDDSHDFWATGMSSLSALCCCIILSTPLTARLQGFIFSLCCKGFIRLTNRRLKDADTYQTVTSVLQHMFTCLHLLPVVKINLKKNPFNWNVLCKNQSTVYMMIPFISFTISRVVLHVI